jgi:hypothetical protein
MQQVTGKDKMKVVTTSRDLIFFADIIKLIDRNNHNGYDKTSFYNTPPAVIDLLKAANYSVTVNGDCFTVQ